MVLYFKRTVSLCHFMPTDCVVIGIISIDFMVKHSTVLYFWLRNAPCQYTIINEWLFPYSFQLCMNLITVCGTKVSTQPSVFNKLEWGIQASFTY